MGYWDALAVPESLRWGPARRGGRSFFYFGGGGIFMLPFLLILWVGALLILMLWSTLYVAACASRLSLVIGNDLVDWRDSRRLKKLPAPPKTSAHSWVNAASQTIVRGDTRASERPSPSPPSRQAQYEPTATASKPPLPPSVQVVCRDCRKQQLVQPEARGFKCVQCGQSFRFLLCPSCNRSLHAHEEWESWTCQHCSHGERSYWSTTQTITCVKCKTNNRFAASAKAFRCAKCSALYERCACGKYVTHPLLRRWKCPFCKRWNVRTDVT